MKISHRINHFPEYSTKFLVLRRWVVENLVNSLLLK
jgi:hypothetical protein